MTNGFEITPPQRSKPAGGKFNAFVPENATPQTMYAKRSDLPLSQLTVNGPLCKTHQVLSSYRCGNKVIVNLLSGSHDN